MNASSKTPLFVYAGVWGSAALNLGFVIINLAIGSYRVAALQSLIVAGCGVWLWFIPKVDAWFDARIGEATAQRRLAELALDAMEQMKRRDGDLRISAIVESAERVN